MIVTTGDLNKDYEVINVIFAFDSAQAGFLSGADPNVAFARAVSALQDTCRKAGGHAVINCQFEYRVAVKDGVFGSKQAVEIFAYGTAVRLLA